MFNVKMNRVEESVGGKSTLDKSGYMTELESVVVNDSEQIGDLKKARLIMKSAVSSNPNSSPRFCLYPSWIAAARIEEFDGKLETARHIIA